MSGLVISVLATLVALKYSKIARYYTKFVIFCVGCVAVTIPFVPFMLFRPRDYRNTFMPARGSLLLGRLLGVTFELRGLENIDKNKGGVVIVNHQSALDMFICSHLSLNIGNFATVVKKEVLYIFPFCWLWGTIFLDRKSKKAGRHMISKESEEIRQKQVKVLIYPEGTRHEGTELLPFKKGAFHIALETHCDIYPVVVSKYHFLDSKTFKFTSGRNFIEILPKISTKGIEKDEIDTLIKSTRDVMQKKYEELSAESLKFQRIK